MEIVSESTCRHRKYVQYFDEEIYSKEAKQKMENIGGLILVFIYRHSIADSLQGVVLQLVGEGGAVRGATNCYTGPQTWRAAVNTVLNLRVQ
jgi:hypothetical protein